jgi:hypothetical protein
MSDNVVKQLIHLYVQYIVLNNSLWKIFSLKMKWIYSKPIFEFNWKYRCTVVFKFFWLGLGLWGYLFLCFILHFYDPIFEVFSGGTWGVPLLCASVETPNPIVEKLKPIKLKVVKSYLLIPTYAKTRLFILVEQKKSLWLKKITHLGTRVLYYDTVGNLWSRPFKFWMLENVFPHQPLKIWVAKFN